MTRICLTIPGQPFAKRRHRVSFAQRRTYDHPENSKFEAVVRELAAQHFPAPLLGPVRVEIVATFAPPQSWSKRKVVDHLHRPHTQKPDRDNLEKAVLDGLNRIAFADDAQVADGRTRKVWGPHAQTVVWIEPMGADEALADFYPAAIPGGDA